MSHQDSLDTALLLIEMLKRIKKDRKITASELHKELVAQGMERDIRTIQRHLDTLSEHFDIERDDRSKPYGYRWKERAEGIAFPVMTAQESLLLTLAHEQIRQLLPPRLLTSMEGFFEQAERNLGPGTKAQRERQWLRKVRVVATTQPLIPPEIDSTVFDNVTAALYEDRVLNLSYRNAAGEDKQASVWPLGLAQQGPRMYLVCRFSGYDNERSLALHRISKAEATNLPFEYPKEFDLARYDADGRFGFGEGERVQLRFRITKEAGLHLTESPLSEDQTVVEHVDCYEISATVVDSEMLRWWMRGFGSAVWCVESSELQSVDITGN